MIGPFHRRDDGDGRGMREGAERRKRGKLDVHFSRKSVHHCTPQSVLVPVRKLAGGVIGLDPCSNPRSEVGALVEWRRSDDGLSRSWLGYGPIYVNPPYGRAIGEWTRRCAEAGDAGEEVVGLLPVRTDTDWWQRDVRRAGAVCFWKGRLVFLGQRHAAPFPSALVFWGSAAYSRRAYAIFHRFGWCATSIEPRATGLVLP